MGSCGLDYYVMLLVITSMNYDVTALISLTYDYLASNVKKARQWYRHHKGGIFKIISAVDKYCADILSLIKQKLKWKPQTTEKAHIILK